jgi:hypothetical protein
MLTPVFPGALPLPDLCPNAISIPQMKEAMSASMRVDLVEHLARHMNRFARDVRRKLPRSWVGGILRGL